MAEKKARYPEIREQARHSPSGVAINDSNASAVESSPAERAQVFGERWGRGGFELLYAYNDLLVSRDANQTVAEFVRSKIREIVKDPHTAELLCPTDYPLGTKRICVDTNYFETFNRPNVKLIDIRSTPISKITPHGIVVGDREYQVDCIVYATGFDAMTGALARIDIRGRSGLALSEVWAAGPRTYLGLMVAGFPNLFTITGPGSPSVLSNMLTSIEQHVEWIADCIGYLGAQGKRQIEATLPAQDAWVEHVNQVASFTLYPQAASWYMGANIPGKPRVFMPYVGGVGTYREKCRAVAAAGYEGFTLLT